MATKPIDVSHAFKGGNPDEYRLDRILMVGAMHDGAGISQNDGMVLRLALNVLDKWQVPVSDDLSLARESRDHVASSKSLRVINILPEHGGEDFLKSDEKGDIVMLCNIAKDVPDTALLKRGNHAYFDLHPSMRSSFTSSADHNNFNKWRDQIEKSGARIAIVTNSDGFELSDIVRSNYVKIDVSNSAGAGRALAIAIRRDYLESINDYLFIQSALSQKASPLLEISDHAAHDASAAFSWSISTGKVCAITPDLKP